MVIRHSLWRMRDIACVYVFLYFIFLYIYNNIFIKNKINIFCDIYKIFLLFIKKHKKCIAYKRICASIISLSTSNIKMIFIIQDIFFKNHFITLSHTVASIWQYPLKKSTIYLSLYLHWNYELLQ